MRDKDGKALLPVWKVYLCGFVYFLAARTRMEAAEITGEPPENLTRVKGVFATGKPREL